MDLERALAARGIVCTVGAGGKKSTMYRLAERVERAAVTATVRIPIFDDEVATVEVTDDPVAALERAEAWPVGVVPEREREDRYRGYDLATVDDLGTADVADAVLVKADGARMRQFKAPDDSEPRIPASADTVLPVVSAHVVGEPLSDERVHRPDRVASVADLAVGEEIDPRHVADVLTAPEGGLRDVPDGATVVPVVNMVDDAALEAVGREVADAVLSRVAERDLAATVPRVALTQMTADDPLIDVVE